MNARTAAAALFSCLVSLAPCAAAPVDDVISKARSFLGREAALDAVTSIHFTGTIELTERVPSESDPSVMIDRPLRLPVEIIFQKPYQQRITVRSEKIIETSALDGYDGWQKRSDAQDTTKWQLTLLDPQQVKRLRANTWENLHFFRGIEKRGGTVEHQGTATVDGVACDKLAFTHAENIIFYRFFDRATGRLVKTETEAGGEIREEGEVVVNGIRFPRRVINRTPDGKMTSISFDQVVLNQVHPGDAFAVPSLTGR
jgi:hypothetical protein